MWIQVRSMDGKTSTRVDGLSKLTKIEDLREKLVETFDASPERQRLFYRGKQLVDGHSLFDYNVGLNEIVQIMVRAAMPVEEVKALSPVKQVTSDTNDKDSQQGECSGQVESQDSGFNEEFDSLYKLGDIIDVRDETMGAWFEARIQKIERRPASEKKDTTQETTEIQKDVVMKEETLQEEIETHSDSDKENTENDENGNIPKKDSNIEMTNSEENSKNIDSSKSDEITKQSVSDSTSENSNTLSKTDAVKTLCPWDAGIAQDDDFLYSIIFEGYEDDDPAKVHARHIRPRAQLKFKFSEVEVGSKVMVNYNYDEPTDRGYWYDAIITGKRSTRTIKEVDCTVFIGKDLVPMEKCAILYRDEIFEIPKPGSQLNINDADGAAQSPVKRKNKPDCDHCQDNPKRKCKECACHKCGGKDKPDMTLMCDECDMAFHIFCLDPPLKAIPDVDEWYCPLCKNDESEVVRAGEKLKESKKKSKMASAQNTSTRDWGRGMACVGRTKKCTVVPPNHFGPIPGVEVGAMWKFRVQASEAGVHRPHVAGIHGREDEGAYSIVLSGGYEDDKDDGDQFTYTGSGGRDLSGNKRTADQSCDQVLTRMNAALAKNCNASIDRKNGADAKDKWKGGKPVRVVRNCKGSKHSRYAPEEGNRYDGIYKMVKYWPAKGKSGFIVWRYLLRRDDQTPAPWTKAGKKRIEELGLEIAYPEGYLEAQAEKEKNTPAKGGKGKRKRNVLDSEDEEDEDDSASPKVTKKAKIAGYKVDEAVSKLITDDEVNIKIWEEALTFTKEGYQKFIGKVEELFCCICCQDVVFRPITTTCSHNICKSCLSRSFKADVYSCPACRTELGQDYKVVINKSLFEALKKLFPGYENGRD